MLGISSVTHGGAIVKAAFGQMSELAVFPVPPPPCPGSMPHRLGDFSPDHPGPGVSIEQPALLAALRAHPVVHGGNDVIPTVAWAAQEQAFMLCVCDPFAMPAHSVASSAIVGFRGVCDKQAALLGCEYHV